MPFSRWPRPTGVRAASTMTTSRPCNLVLMQGSLANDRSLSAVNVGVDVEGGGVDELEVALQRDERRRRADQGLDVAALVALDDSCGADLHVEEVERDRDAGNDLQDVGHVHGERVVVRAGLERLERRVERHV